MEGLCDDGCNRWTDASKHHQVVRPIFYCIVEGFQPFRIITLGSNTQKEKPKLETTFPRDTGPTVDSHKQILLMGNLLGLSSPLVGLLFKPALSACGKPSEAWPWYPHPGSPPPSALPPRTSGSPAISLQSTLRNGPQNALLGSSLLQSFIF